MPVLLADLPWRAPASTAHAVVYSRDTVVRETRRRTAIAAIRKER